MAGRSGTPTQLDMVVFVPAGVVSWLVTVAAKVLWVSAIRETVEEVAV